MAPRPSSGCCGCSACCGWRAAGRHRWASLALLAAAAGYADQAHMARELRALTGQTAAALLPAAASTLELSELFKTAPAATA